MIILINLRLSGSFLIRNEMAGVPNVGMVDANAQRLPLENLFSQTNTLISALTIWSSCFLLSWFIY